MSECVRACARARVCVRTRACARAYVYVFVEGQGCASVCACV